MQTPGARCSLRAMSAGPQSGILLDATEVDRAGEIRVSLVVPVFNEAGNLRELFGQVKAVAEGVALTTWELVFVNDGSRDKSLAILDELALEDPRVQVVDLSRNYGKEAALTAGMDAASGDVVVFMDADLQHPPAVLPRLIEKWRDGAEVVVAVRKRIEQSFFRRVASRIFYLSMRRFSDHGATLGSTDFRLLDRGVCEAMKHVTERARLFRGLVDWLGFRRAEVPFEAEERHAGGPSYTVAQLFRLAVSSFISHSQFPLRFVLYVGAFASAMSALGLVWMQFAEVLVHPKWHYTPLAKAVVFNTGLVGMLQISLGLVAIYLGKVLGEVSGRPVYVARRRKPRAPRT